MSLPISSRSLQTYQDEAKSLLQTMARAAELLKDPNGPFFRKIEGPDEHGRQFKEFSRILDTLNRYTKSDPELRYVALAGTFSSAKTATINSLLGVRGTSQARKEDNNPVDVTITLCAHRSQEKALLTSLTNEVWRPATFFHDFEPFSKIILVDTPGSGDPGIRGIRKDMVRNFLPICDTLAYCFLSAAPLSDSDVPLLEDLYNNMLYADFFFVYNLADLIYRSNKGEKITDQNFDREKADKDLKDFAKRLKDALSERILPDRQPLLEGEPEVMFVSNEDSFGIEDLRRRLRNAPADTSELNRRKLLFLRRQAGSAVKFFAKSAKDTQTIIRNLMVSVRKAHTEFNQGFEKSTQKILKSWQASRELLKSGQQLLDQLQVSELQKAASVDSLLREAREELKIAESIQRRCRRLAGDADSWIEGAAKQALKRWTADLTKGLNDEGRESLDRMPPLTLLEGDASALAELDEHILRPAAVVDDLTRSILVRALDEVERRCGAVGRELRLWEDSAKEARLLTTAADRIALGEKEISEWVDEYAGLIRLYFGGVAQGGNAESIAAAEMAREIDDLQRKQIPSEDRVKIALELAGQLFGKAGEQVDTTLKRCQVLAQELERARRTLNGLEEEAVRSLNLTRATDEFADHASLSRFGATNVGDLTEAYRKRLHDQERQIRDEINGKFTSEQDKYNTSLAGVKKAWTTGFVVLGIFGLVAFVGGSLIYVQFGGDPGTSISSTLFWSVAASAVWELIMWGGWRLTTSGTPWLIESRETALNRARDEVLDYLRNYRLREPTDLAKAKEKILGRFVAEVERAFDRTLQRHGSALREITTQYETTRAAAHNHALEYRQVARTTAYTAQLLFAETTERTEYFRSIGFKLKKSSVDRLRQLLLNRLRLIRPTVQELAQNERALG